MPSTAKETTENTPCAGLGSEDQLRKDGALVGSTPIFLSLFCLGIA